jgi:predicted ATPase
LALAAANEIQFADGIRFIPLAAIGSRGSLVHAITDSLHLQLHSSADAREQLFAHLQQHKLLLILDNFEHLLSPSGHKEGSNQDSIALVIDILEHAPDVRILVTSRERLNLSAEWVFNVEGLQTPSLAEGYDNLKVENFSAVQLFLQRACQLKRDFGKGQDELTCVARICHLAGGLPLAIELAAAWVNTLSCREILQEIERSLKFLRTNLRDYPERHRDMRAVFDTSWNMLTDSEQQLFRRLSVFRGGFNRVAAEAVGGKIKWTEEDLSLEPEGTLQLGKRQPEVLAALAGLVDKSFVQQPLNGRYEIHELMRQYGAAKLLERPDDEKKSRNTHTRYYLTLLEHQEKPLRGAEQRLILEKLVPEIENIKVAWKWAVTSQQLGWLVQMLPGLLWLFELRNDYQDAAALTLNAAETFRSKLGLDTTDNPVERNHFAFLLSQAGWFAFLSGQTERGRMLSDEAFSLAGPEGRPVHLWHMNSERGYMELAVGNFGKARHYSQKGLAYAKRLTDPWYLGYPLAHLGMISLGEGKPQDAYDRLKESLAIWSDIGDQRGLIFTYTHLGTATLSLGRSEEALTYAENSLALSIDTDDRWSQANALNLIGQVQASRGDYEMAKISFQKSAKLHREVGDIRNMAQTQVKLGNAAFDAEKNKQAKTAFLEALSAAKQAQVVATGLEALLGLARIEARRNRFEWAHSLGIYVAKHTQGNQYIRDAAKQVCVEIEKRVEFKGSNESKDQFQGNTFEEVVKSIQVEST